MPRVSRRRGALGALGLACGCLLLLAEEENCHTFALFPALLAGWSRYAAPGKAAALFVRPTGTLERSARDVSAHFAPEGKVEARLGEGQEGQAGQEGQEGWEIVVILCALGIMISYADRSNISVAIIGMARDFQWDKAFEGTVLSAFFGGYAATQLLGGQLADSLGAKWILAAGLSCWSLATALTPLAAASGAAPLLATRLALGLGEGVAFPAVHSAIAKLVPRSQQSTAVALVTAASYAGAGLAFLLVPGIVETYGWQVSFFGFGALALLWLPPWLAQAPETGRSTGVELSASQLTKNFSKTVEALSHDGHLCWWLRGL
eukprot:s207_g7.t4